MSAATKAWPTTTISSDLIIGHEAILLVGRILVVRQQQLRPYFFVEITLVCLSGFDKEAIPVLRVCTARPASQHYDVAHISVGFLDCLLCRCCAS